MLGEMRLAFVSIVICCNLAACGDAFVTSGAGGAGGGDGGNCELEVPAAPDGWAGPFIMSRAPENGGSCPGGGAPVVSLSLATATDQCTCDCQPRVDRCVATLKTHQTNCDDGADGDVQVTTCAALAGVGAAEFSGAGPPKGEHLCELAGAGTPPQLLEGEVALCAVEEGCAPPPPAGFERRTCLAKEGKQPCPAGFDFVAYLASSYSDNRGCDCACGADGAQCAGTVTLYAADGCGTAETTLSLGACKPTAALSAGYEPGLDGACSVTSSTVTGSLAVADERTLCCTEP
jgi:hypothetical protein